MKKFEKLLYAKLAIEKGLAQGRDGSYIKQLYMNYFTKLKLYIRSITTQDN
ncbi:hypothetical protein Lser_V15G29945 [Lactuca serriola]